MSVYTKLADALDSMVDSPETFAEEPAIPVIESILAISEGAHAFLETIP